MKLLTGNSNKTLSKKIAVKLKSKLINSSIRKFDDGEIYIEINENIRAQEVRVIADGVEPTVYPISKAIEMAEEQGLDLVEISPNATPPVCKIIDYKKFLYDQKKKQKEIKAKAQKIVLKEIRFYTIF